MGGTEAAYPRAAFQAARTNFTQDDLDKAVANRLARAKLLQTPSGPIATTVSRRVLASSLNPRQTPRLQVGASPRSLRRAVTRPRDARGEFLHVLAMFHVDHGFRDFPQG